jgi:hypothetical protein
MQKLSLEKDFEFGMLDHCFHYSEDITLVPTLSGFSILYKGKEVEKGLNTEQALEAVQKHLEEIEEIKEDHILGDYLLNKEEN